MLQVCYISLIGLFNFNFKKKKKLGFALFVVDNMACRYIKRAKLEDIKMAEPLNMASEKENGGGLKFTDGMFR